MKYRHAYHAGNFADVHKHVTLMALLESMQRKEKGFLFIDTHAGSGFYELHGSQPGFSRISEHVFDADELKRYSARVHEYRDRVHNKAAYPGSPVIATESLRSHDRAIFVEQIASEARALERALPPHPKTRIETGDGFATLRASFPPVERRGLVLIDPPYEETQQDFGRIGIAINEALKRFQTAVIAVWYPIKDARDIAIWHASLAQGITTETLVSELWLFPCDSRVALNGSGILIVNPPYQIEERMRVWLPELQASLDTSNTGGWRIRTLAQPV
jgi:23S rRNA (adenine2030-N6)-methyltransferase